jgi:hypothetical protein
LVLLLTQPIRGRAADENKSGQSGDSYAFEQAGPRATTPPSAENRPKTASLTPAPDQLSFYAFFFLKGTATNLTGNFPQNLFEGVIGRLFGPADEAIYGAETTLVNPDDDTLVDPKMNRFIEERLVPTFAYAPAILDRRALLHASFEIDFSFGDAANRSEGNSGGGFNADNVNIQTKDLFAELRFWQSRLRLFAGLQPIYDNVKVPTEATLYDLGHSGYKLGFFSSDAAGLALFGTLTPRLQTKLAWYSLYENEPAESDDVGLWQLDGNFRLAPQTNIGLSLWYLADRGNTLGVNHKAGFDSNPADINGATFFDLYNLGAELITQAGYDSVDILDYRYQADILWLGLNGNHNLGFSFDDWLVSGFAMLNFGEVRATWNAENGADATPLTYKKAIRLQGGLAANLEVAYKFGRTHNDFVSLQGLYTSGDNNLQNGYRGLITGQNYGLPGATYTGHGSYLLFPNAYSINYYYAAVADLGNRELGVTGMFSQASYDLLANRFNVRLGSATALANSDAPETMTNPERYQNQGRLMGTEVNATLTYRLLTFLDVGLQGAYVWLGDFYDGVIPNPAGSGAGSKPDNPWIIYTSLTWIAF